MLQESLPPGSDLPPYDPEAFSSPLSSLPTPLQQAASWAWGNHFRHLAADLNYCLDCMPEPGDGGGAWGGQRSKRNVPGCCWWACVCTCVCVNVCVRVRAQACVCVYACVCLPGLVVTCKRPPGAII